MGTLQAAKTRGSRDGAGANLAELLRKRVERVDKLEVRPMPFCKQTLHPGSWDIRFLRLAQEISKWSKDPSTKAGAVIVAPDNSIISTGFNGLPRGIFDSSATLHDREKKYKLIIHADLNAILYAKRPLDINAFPEGATIYTWPFQPCSSCASCIIQVGIKKVVFPTPPSMHPRWEDSFQLAMDIFAEAKTNVLSLYDEELSKSVKELWK